ncbi:retrovirus-related pol polyprotein from transposon TNT 1-94 [Tanacetum coccineum]
MISLREKNTLAEYMILSEHGRMILESVENGPLIWPTVEENGVTRTKKYAELSAAEKIQADCDMKATNIILQGLPADIYSLERECKLYDAFDKFTHIKGESLHKYYLRFTQLINDMNIYNMKMEQFQVNTKFLNSLPPEWSKFVTDVKLVKDLHTTNFDQLHAYLEQHELHANEVRLLRERNQEPLVLVANHQMTPPHFNTYQSSYNNPQLQQAVFHIINMDQITQPALLIYLSITTSIQSFICSIIISISVPIASSNLICSTKMMKPMLVSQGHGFSKSVASQGFPIRTNNQLRTSSNPRNQATIQDGRVISNATSSGGNNTSGHARVVKCYNCQGEGHMARQCTQPKRPRNSAWYKEKAMLAKAQEAGQIWMKSNSHFLQI